MTIITVDFSDEENKKIGIVKAIHNLPSKEEAVKKIVQMHKIQN
jgi:hypothetical protein